MGRASSWTPVEVGDVDVFDITDIALAQVYSLVLTTTGDIWYAGKPPAYFAGLQGSATFKPFPVLKNIRLLATSLQDLYAVQDENIVWRGGARAKIAPVYQFCEFIYSLTC